MILFAAALLLIKPGWITDLIGILIALGVGMVHLRRHRREQKAGKPIEITAVGGSEA